MPRVRARPLASSPSPPRLTRSMIRNARHALAWLEGACSPGAMSVTPEPAPAGSPAGWLARRHLRHGRSPVAPGPTGVEVQSSWPRQLQLGGHLRNREASEADEALELGRSASRLGRQSDRAGDDAAFGFERRGDAAKVVRELLEVHRVPLRAYLLEVVREDRCVGDRPPRVCLERLICDVARDRLTALGGEQGLPQRERMGRPGESADDTD